MTPELWLHVIEVVILLVGVAAPMVYGALKLRVLMKQFPLHLHVNGKIVYPAGYEPPEVKPLVAVVNNV